MWCTLQPSIERCHGSIAHRERWEKEFGFVPPCSRAHALRACTRRTSKRSAALLSPLTFATDVGTATQVDVTLSESDEFRDAKPGLDGEQQQATISSTKHSLNSSKKRPLE